MRMHDLVQRLRLDLKLPYLTLPASGVCAFNLDAVTVTMNLHRSSDAFTVRSLVAQLTDSDFLVKAQRLLAANLVTGPCYFSIDSNGAAYATQYFRLPTLSYGRFIQSLERFIDVVERWQRLLAPAEQESAA